MPEKSFATRWRPETSELRDDPERSGRPTPFDTTAKRQDLALLHRALRELPADKRELIILARFQDLTYEQIGSIIGCGAGTVKHSHVPLAMKELGHIYSALSKEKAS